MHLKIMICWCGKLTFTLEGWAKHIKREHPEIQILAHNGKGYTPNELIEILKRDKK